MASPSRHLFMFAHKMRCFLRTSQRFSLHAPPPPSALFFVYHPCVLFGVAKGIDANDESQQANLLADRTKR
jgi:hypothetical protein